MYEYYITPEEYEIDKKNGISRKTLESRIRDYGWSKKKALEKPPRKIKNKFTNVDIHRFYARVNRNKWSIERAAHKEQ